MTVETEIKADTTLLDMLSYRRPAWSKSEHEFITEYIMPLGVTVDQFGNLHKRIGKAPVLWSSHTDTVHTVGGKNKLSVDNGIVRAKNSNCLGADCTAGVWLMIEMIRANRPGLYVFHRAEEIGGKGSEYIAHSTPELLDGIKYAIAFDRRDTWSVITHQFGGRCCSDVFAVSLAAALDMGHAPDSTGSFTDTANYTDLIGECSNLSVGYLHEHTKNETLDTRYLFKLRDALLRLDVHDLVSERQPGEYDDNDWLSWLHCEDQEPRCTSRTLASLLKDHPDEVADWLDHHGVDVSEIETAIQLRGGVLR